MRTETLKKYLNDELFAIATGDTQGNEVSSGKIQKNILSKCKDEKYLSLFLEATVQSIQNDPFLFFADKVGNKIIKYVEKEYEGSNKETLIKKYILPFKIDVQNALSKRGEQSRVLIESSTLKFSQMPGEFKKIQENPEIMERLIKAIEDCSGADIHEPRPPFNDVPLDTQHMVIGKLPRSIEESIQYVDNLIKKNGSLFISCHETRTVAEEGCYDFWKQEKVYEALGLKGCKMYEETIAKGEISELTGRTPSIIKTVITFENKKDPLVHLHYEGWENRTPCPDSKLLQILVEQAIELSPTPSNPIAINCHGGIGRSGAVAALLLTLKGIYEQLKNTEIDKVSFNIPQSICESRKYRQSLLWSSANQLIPVYSVLARCYGTLSNLVIKK